MNSGGKLHEVDASVSPPEETTALMDMFNLIDLHCSDGIASIKSFSDKLATLTKVHV
jgi:hypothetical protein